MNFQVTIPSLRSAGRADDFGTIQRRGTIAEVLRKGAVATGERSDSGSSLYETGLASCVEVSTERPHIVRLTPVGKTYVQYSVRESPFVSKLCETTLTVICQDGSVWTMGDRTRLPCAPARKLREADAQTAKDGKRKTMAVTPSRLPV